MENENWIKNSLDCYNKVASVSANTAYDLHLEEIMCDQIQKQVNSLKQQYKKRQAEFEMAQLKYDLYLQTIKMLNENIRITENLICTKKRAFEARKKEINRMEKTKFKTTCEMELCNIKFNQVLKEAVETCETFPLARKRKELQILLTKENIMLGMTRKSFAEFQEKKKQILEMQRKIKTIQFVRFARVILQYNKFEKMSKEIKKIEKDQLELKLWKEKQEYKSAINIEQNNVATSSFYSLNPFQLLKPLSPIRLNNPNIFVESILAKSQINPLQEEMIFLQKVNIQTKRMTESSISTPSKKPIRTKRMIESPVLTPPKKPMFEKIPSPPVSPKKPQQISTLQFLNKENSNLDQNSPFIVPLMKTPKKSKIDTPDENFTGNTQILRELSISDTQTSEKSCIRTDMDKTLEPEIQYKHFLHTSDKIDSPFFKLPKPVSFESVTKENEVQTQLIPEPSVSNITQESIYNYNETKTTDSTEIKMADDNLENDYMESSSQDVCSGSIKKFPESSFVLSPISSPGASPRHIKMLSPTTSASPNKHIFGLFGKETPKSKLKSPFSFSFGDTKPKTHSFLNMF